MAGKAPTRTALICAVTGAALLLAPGLAPSSAATDDGDDLSARELAGQAKDNLLDAESLRMKLTDRSATTSTSKTQPTSMDLALDRDGNCAGTMEMGSDGGSVEIVKRGEEVWMKPDTAFWKAQVPGGQGDEAAELFDDRYIHGSTRDALLKGMADTCDLTVFQKEVATPDTSSGDTALTKGEATTRDDTRVIPLRGEEGGNKVVLYVTSDSPHRVAEVTQKGKSTDLTLTFTDYDKPVPSETPAPDESVDVGKMREELESV